MRRRRSARLEQHHLARGFFLAREESRPQAGQTATHDHQVGSLLAFERGPRLGRIGLVEPEGSRLGLGVGAADGLRVHGSVSASEIEAEGEGFEPPGPSRGRLLSRQLHSTGLCHPSDEVIRGRRHRATTCMALLVEILPTVGGKHVQPIVRATVTRLTTYPVELEWIRRRSTSRVATYFTAHDAARRRRRR